MDKKLLVFNWKMNPQSLDEAKRLLECNLEQATKNKNGEIVVCPPFIYLSELSSVVGQKSLIKLGSQDVFWENEGAYTGEVSALMLKNSNVKYVILGHSERRRYLGETDLMINKKVLAVLSAGLNLVLCVGEPFRKSQSVNRKAQILLAKNYVKKQLQKDLRGVESLAVGRESLVRNLMIAYEPVWAIGTGKPCHPEDAGEIIRFTKTILNSKFPALSAGRQILNSRVLYGGSVDSQNAKSFVEYDDVDGVLVGGASLKLEEVKKIINLL